VAALEPGAARRSHELHDDDNARTAPATARLGGFVRAVQIDGPDGPSALVVRDVPEPPAGAGQVLIDVRAAGVGQLDVVCCHGRHQLRPEFPFTPGFEVAGVVRHAPPGAGVSAGDRVAAYVDSGGFAEVVAADAGVVVPVPEDVALTDAAALPVNALTALYALLDRAALRPGEVVVVHGAAGGLGMTAARVARLHGAEPIAVVSSEQRGALATSIGCSGFVLTEGDWVAAMRQALAERGVEGADVVVDPVGGDRLAQSMRFTRPKGRLVSLGFVAGIPEVQVNRLLVRNLDLIGADWMPSDPVTGERLVPWLRDNLRELAAASIVTRVEPLASAAPLLEALERRRLVGKAVLEI
jgi:NADPH:quinone reductase